MAKYVGVIKVICKQDVLNCKKSNYYSNCELVKSQILIKGLIFDNQKMDREIKGVQESDNQKVTVMLTLLMGHCPWLG